MGGIGRRWESGAGGIRLGRPPYPTFKKLYKNPLDILKGYLVREKLVFASTKPGGEKMVKWWFWAFPDDDPKKW